MQYIFYQYSVHSFKSKKNSVLNFLLSHLFCVTFLRTARDNGKVGGGGDKLYGEVMILMY
jgi:hypothetical protein